MSRYSPNQYNNITNSIFKLFIKSNRNHKSDLIINATPVSRDINIVKKYITPEKLEELKLDMGYSSNIGFKVTVVLKKYSSCPVSLIIHSDAKNDSKIYEEILQELKRRRLLRKKQVIYFNKYYYSMENYLIGIKEYNIITIIFPRQYFRIEKLEAKMSTRLDIFYDEKKN